MGKGPGIFSDIGKKAKDLLTKDYFQDQKLVITTETDCGLIFTTSSLKKKDLLTGDILTQFKNKNVTAEVKVDTNSSLTTTITVDELVRGLKTVLNATVPEPAGKLEFQYRHEHAGICSTIGLTAVPVVEVNAAFGAEAFAFGGEVAFDTGSGAFTKYNAGIGVTKPDFCAALLLADKAEVVKVSCLYNVNNETKTTVAGEVLHRFPTRDTTVTVGASYALDKLTTVKTRLNNHGKLGALLQHEIRPKSTITISTEVDTKALDKDPKVGLALALKP
ncbi:hypothetical protein KP509_27G011600 [Ceratopteris richardii]|uniref:Uncharacterized protein n=1 Tax=Ceratopteris richardii TaxID=49495 RepID=A0A8T2RDX1_CERRI|nr:hypothetical protein KP509_27G011600 [Ceratopteris richardii]KAH7294652.1 hypothetical protein KP509_27G011600 [Ceratopteris richardii]